MSREMDEKAGVLLSLAKSDTTNTTSHSPQDNSDGLRCTILRRTNGTWSQTEASVNELCHLKTSEGDVTIIFLPPESDIRDDTRTTLCRRFSVPGTFWSCLAQEASGYVGCQERRDSEGKIKSFRTTSRWLIKASLSTGSGNGKKLDTKYIWHRLGFFTNWVSPKTLTVLCFDLPRDFQDELSKNILECGTELSSHDAFSFEAFVLESIVALFDKALWRFRNIVRALEKDRIQFENPQPDLEGLHELARHVIHCSETLAIAIETVTSMIQEHDLFFSENTNLPIASIVAGKQNSKTLRYCKSLFKCLHLRSKALEARLKNESNLIFHAVAQYDSRIAVRIGKLTKIDSAAMKTVSVLGLIFLPANFVCAVFSTTFFNYTPASESQDENWTMSNMFWLYWVITIPLTLAIWLFWRHWQKNFTGLSPMPLEYEKKPRDLKRTFKQEIKESMCFSV